MMRRLVPVLILVVVVVACGPDGPPEPPPLEVRLVTSILHSGRWEREAERGLGLIAAELGAEVARLRAEQAGKRRAVLERLGSEEVDLVFCVGPGFDAVLYTEAAAHPASSYVRLPGDSGGRNLAAIRFQTSDAGFLAGAAAAALAGDDRGVGILRGRGGPWLEDLEDGFVSGLLTARPDAEVLTGAGVDGAWSLLEDGVGVVLYATDTPDRAVLAAAHDAGLMLIATDPGLLRDAEATVVAAVQVDVAEAMLRVAREVADGTFSGRVYVFDLGSGVLSLELDREHPEAGRAEVLAAVEAARSAITAGFVEIENLGIG